MAKRSTPSESPESAWLARFDAVAEPPLLALAMREPQLRRSVGHRHLRGQLYALTQGLLRVESDAGRWVMPAGCVGWIPPGVAHAALGHGPVAGWSAYLAPALCEGLPAEPCVLDASALVAPVVARAVAWSAAARPGVPLPATQQRLAEVLADELRQAPREALRLPFPADRRLVKIAQRLAADPADARTLGEWAAWAGLSTRSLTRHFLAETGLSFIHWRQRARMVRALELLAAGRSVGTVADALGYQSPSTFAALFRQQFGRPPSRYFGGAEPSATGLSR